MNMVGQLKNWIKKTELVRPGIILLVLLALPYSTLGDLNLGAQIRNQSLDGRLIQLNGGIGCDIGAFMGWWYEWGDGTITSSYFPTYHRYESPGLYEILIKGYDDQGNSKTVSVKHEVFALPRTDINEVHLSEYFIGLSDYDDIGYVEIIAKNASGETVSLSEHNVELYDPIYNELNPSFNNYLSGSNLIITPKPEFQDGLISIGYIYVFVDGVEADKPVTVILNRNEAEYDSIVGEYVVSYLPQTFFEMSEMPSDDYRKILDLGYLWGNWFARELFYESGRMLYGVTYNPPAHGASGNPISIGDTAMPRNGIPQIGIIIHEMGHEFQWLPTCLMQFGIGVGPFYQETMSEWIKQATYHMILLHNRDEISQTAIDMVEYSLNESSELHRQWYERYINEGCPFDYSVTLYGSQPLVQLIYEYSNTYGWDKIRRFMDHFQYDYTPDLARIFTYHGGIELLENRVTMMAGVLSSTFDIDVRPDFERLNFPYNNSLYDDLIALFAAADFNGNNYLDASALTKLANSNSN